MYIDPKACSSVNQTKAQQETPDGTSYSVEKVVNVINRASNYMFGGAVIFSAGKQLLFYNKEISKYVFDHQIFLASGGWGLKQEKAFIFKSAVTGFVIDVLYAGGAYLGVRAINYVVIKLNDYLIRPTNENSSIKKSIS